MEKKQELDDFLDDLNAGAKNGQVFTYNWWPENHLKLQYGGKTVMRVIADTAEESYEEMLRSLKALLRDKIKEYTEEHRVIWS